MTDRQGLLLGALAADCAPILMVDPEARVIAAVHAGWRGALAGVAQNAVARMAERGARAERICAAVGPCIGPRSYEVGEEFKAAFEARRSRPTRASSSRGASRGSSGSTCPRSFSRRSRRRAWARPTGPVTTPTQMRDFFSNRRAFHRGEPDYGRLLSAIVLS